MTDMLYRPLGRTQLTVSALALGTVELGIDYGIAAPGHFGRPSEAAAIDLVHATLDSGINFIDTARAYGESEAVLGKALQGRRDQVVLATKVAIHQPDGSLPTAAALRQHMLDSLDTSLRLLQTDRVDLWQLHNVDAAILARRSEIQDVFEEALRSGKIQATGGSFYGAELPAQALEYDLFDVIQVTYSVFDQRLASHVLPMAQARNVGVMVRSVLLKGALTERAEHLPDSLEPLRARSRHYRRIVAEQGLGLTAAQAAIAFAVAQPQISSVLVGIRSREELAENLPALTTQLPPALLQQLYALRVEDEDLINPGTWGF
ncbi:MAG: aldo/keto reductase [Caldilineaceae bacterium]|nr:aldo/keto reductase [Caldilineaceae bacterium]